MMDYQNYIIRDPKVCGGEPVIKGTRVTLRTILASLAEGASFDELLEDFPTLKEQDVRAAIAVLRGIGMLPGTASMIGPEDPREIASLQEALAHHREQQIADRRKHFGLSRTYGE